MTMYYWGKSFGATIVFAEMSNLQKIVTNYPSLFAGFLLGSLVLSFAVFIAGTPTFNKALILNVHSINQTSLAS